MYHVFTPKLLALDSSLILCLPAEKTTAFASTMRNDDPPLAIPRPGLEIVPWAALTRVSVPGCAALSPRLCGLASATFGPLVICAVYQSLLTVFRTEPYVRRGELNRVAQLRMVMTNLVRAKAALSPSCFSVSLALSMLRLLLPAVSIPLAIFAVFGIGRISERMFNSFWDGLDAQQQAELKRKAYQAGIDLRYRLDLFEAGLVP